MESTQFFKPLPLAHRPGIKTSLLQIRNMGDFSEAKNNVGFLQPFKMSYPFYWLLRAGLSPIVVIG